MDEAMSKEWWVGDVCITAHFQISTFMLGVLWSHDPHQDGASCLTFGAGPAGLSFEFYKPVNSTSEEKPDG